MSNNVQNFSYVCPDCGHSACTRVISGEYRCQNCKRHFKPAQNTGQLPSDPINEEEENIDLDEDALEAAFWNFDTQRKKTGAERDAFKGKMRQLIRQHIRADRKRALEASLDDLEWMDRIYAEVREIVAKKNAAYGQSLDKQGALGTAYLASIKTDRLKNLITLGGPDNGESIEDSGLDLLGYSFHFLRLVREGKIS